MAVASVTSKGQVTIPKALWQRLGIRQGSRIEFSLVGEHVEMRVRSSPSNDAQGGFSACSRANASLCRRISNPPPCSNDDWLGPKAVVAPSPNSQVSPLFVEEELERVWIFGVIHPADHLLGQDVLWNLPCPQLNRIDVLEAKLCAQLSCPQQQIRVNWVNRIRPGAGFDALALEGAKKWRSCRSSNLPLSASDDVPWSLFKARVGYMSAMLVESYFPPTPTYGADSLIV